MQRGVIVISLILNGKTLLVRSQFQCHLQYGRPDDSHCVFLPPLLPFIHLVSSEFHMRAAEIEKRSVTSGNDAMFPWLRLLGLPLTAPCDSENITNLVVISLASLCLGCDVGVRLPRRLLV
jgi:hypothetical protein